MVTHRGMLSWLKNLIVVMVWGLGFSVTVLAAPSSEGSYLIYVGARRESSGVANSRRIHLIDPVPSQNGFLIYHASIFGEQFLSAAVARSELSQKLSLFLLNDQGELSFTEWTDFELAPAWAAPASVDDRDDPFEGSVRVVSNYALVAPAGGSHVIAVRPSNEIQMINADGLVKRVAGSGWFPQGKLGQIQQIQLIHRDYLAVASDRALRIARFDSDGSLLVGNILAEIDLETIFLNDGTGYVVQMAADLARVWLGVVHFYPNGSSAYSYWLVDLNEGTVSKVIDTTLPSELEAPGAFRRQVSVGPTFLDLDPLTGELEFRVGDNRIALSTSGDLRLVREGEFSLPKAIAKNTLDGKNVIVQTPKASWDRVSRQRKTIFEPRSPRDFMGLIKRSFVRPAEALSAERFASWVNTAENPTLGYYFQILRQPGCPAEFARRLREQGIEVRAKLIGLNPPRREESDKEVAVDIPAIARILAEAALWERNQKPEANACARLLF